MKNYEEIANSVFERRDAYVTRQKQKRRTAMKIASATCAFALVALLGVGAWQSGWLTPDTPPVDDPAVTAPTTEPTEDNGPGIGGDGENYCKVHSHQYHAETNFRGKSDWLSYLGEDYDLEDRTIIGFVEFEEITREEFMEVQGWTEETLDEIVWAHGNGCPYTQRQFLDAIYGDDPELTAWVFAYESNWPHSDKWDLSGDDEEMMPKDWPPEGYGFGETPPTEIEEPAE